MAQADSMTKATSHLASATLTTVGVAAAAALGVLLTACGSQRTAGLPGPTAGPQTKAALAAGPPSTATEAARAAATASAPAASTPPTATVPTAAAVPAATAPTAAARTATPAAATPGVPHFGSAEATARYLVTAYNTGNEVAIRHVTTPGSRDQFEAERQWVKTFKFRSCAANGAPTWDYACVLDIVTTMPSVQAATDPTTGAQIMDHVTVLVSPAARTGFYLSANEGCGGG